MWSKAVTLSIAVMLMVPWSSAESTFGSIVGVVKDPSQSAVAGAQLTLTNLEDRSQRNATSDANGGFEFINLKPAHYELIVHADGFSDYRVSSLQLDARQSLRFDVPLKVATSAQTIEVSSDAGPQIATKIGTELHDQYVLGYHPSNQTRDANWRKVTIRLRSTNNTSHLNARETRLLRA